MRKTNMFIDPNQKPVVAKEDKKKLNALINEIKEFEKNHKKSALKDKKYEEMINFLSSCFDVEVKAYNSHNIINSNPDTIYIDIDSAIKAFIYRDKNFDDYSFEGTAFNNDPSTTMFEYFLSTKKSDMKYSRSSYNFINGCYEKLEYDFGFENWYKPAHDFLKDHLTEGNDFETVRKGLAEITKKYRNINNNQVSELYGLLTNKVFINDPDKEIVKKGNCFYFLISNGGKIRVINRLKTLLEEGKLLFKDDIDDSAIKVIEDITDDRSDYIIKNYINTDKKFVIVKYKKVNGNIEIYLDKIMNPIHQNSLWLDWHGLISVNRIEGILQFESRKALNDYIRKILNDNGGSVSIKNTSYLEFSYATNLNNLKVVEETSMLYGIPKIYCPYTYKILLEKIEWKDF